MRTGAIELWQKTWRCKQRHYKEVALRAGSGLRLRLTLDRLLRLAGRL
jgi:hypothetical protein